MMRFTVQLDDLNNLSKLNNFHPILIRGNTVAIDLVGGVEVALADLGIFLDLDNVNVYLSNEYSLCG